MKYNAYLVFSGSEIHQISWSWNPKLAKDQWSYFLYAHFDIFENNV